MQDFCMGIISLFTRFARVLFVTKNQALRDASYKTAGGL